ncbi:Gfo/Idh/MocA family oxidoreductase [Amycolatopsis sp. NPDC026612]|uniref:Gfo/Idh/MocA family protein n=1 Tax=Amycolatopsis sp. NPDC026612 TaxID=3155466 RepID=UPI0033ECCEB0
MIGRRRRSPNAAGRAKGRGGGPVRVGLVGAGRQGRTLGHALMEVAGAQLVAVVDPQIGSAQLVAAECHLPSSAARTRIGDCDRSDADVWIIATPPNAHLTNFAELLRLPTRPRAVLCEKPAAWSLQDVMQLVSLAKNSGVHLQFGLHLLSAIPPAVLSWLAAGGLGRLVDVAGTWLRVDGDPDWGHFRTGHCPGATFDLGPHLLGVMLPVLGRRSPICAVTSKMVSALATPLLEGGPIRRDSSAEIAMFRSRPGGLEGAGTLSVAWSGRGTGAELTILLRGTEAAFAMHLDEGCGDAVVRVRVDARSARATGVAGKWETPARECYIRQLITLVEAADAGVAAYVPPGARAQDAVASTRLITAAYQSADKDGELISW